MSKHCRDCSDDPKGRTCGHYHIYAIELRPNVLEEQNFPFQGQLGKGKRVFYVGQTAHRPECRYNQHVARRNRSHMHFKCGCFTDELVRRPLRKSGRFVQKYHMPMGLRPELYGRLNPAVRKVDSIQGFCELQELREEAERTLAERLRALGHAVHYA